MDDDMNAYVYADTYASSQNDIATKTPLVSTSIIEGFIVGKVHHEVGYVEACMNNPVHSVAFTHVVAKVHDQQDGRAFSYVGDDPYVDAFASNADLYSRSGTKVYTELTCNASCWEGQDDN